MRSTLALRGSNSIHSGGYVRTSANGAHGAGGAFDGSGSKAVDAESLAEHFQHA